MTKKRRIFSEVLKREIVDDLEHNRIRICELVREYQVSHTTVYRWLYSYGKTENKGVRMVLEKDSESKKTKDLEKKISELERLLGQKQIEIEYLNKVIEISSKDFKCDLKKKFEPKS